MVLNDIGMSSVARSSPYNKRGGGGGGGVDYAFCRRTCNLFVHCVICICVMCVMCHVSVHVYRYSYKQSILSVQHVWTSKAYTCIHALPTQWACWEAEHSCVHQICSMQKIAILGWNDSSHTYIRFGHTVHTAHVTSAYCTSNITHHNLQHAIAQHVGVMM